MSFKKSYILAQEAEERVVSLFRKERNDAANIFNTAIDACQSVILDMYDNAPDAVEVVRCKDCDNWNEECSAGKERLGNYVCACSHWSVEDGVTLYTKPEDYCSYGERREDEIN